MASRMKLTIEMGDPVGTLLEEIRYPGITQDSVAITYAFIIAQKGDDAPWPEINAAIRDKWKSKTALRRVKEAAWKIVEEWRAKQVPA